MLTAGTSKVNITPKKGIELAGYPHFPRYNTGVHDPLFAGCIYLDDGRENMLIISMDLLFFSKKYVREVRKKINKETSIPVGNVFISVTHTHSGPWTSGRIDLEALEEGLDIDRNYLEQLKDKLVTLAVNASSNTFDASTSTGSVICGKERGIGGNRRDPEGPSDPRLWVIAIRDNAGILRAAMVKYALHPTVLHEDNTLVTADYPGYIREYLDKHFSNLNFLFLQGTSGDQSTRYFREGQDFDEAARIGYELGAATARILENMQFENNVVLKVLSKEIDIPLKILPSEEEAAAIVDKTRVEWERLKKEEAPYLEVQNANLRNLGAEDTLGYARLKKKNIPISLEVDELPAEIQVLGIGDTRIVGLPGEIFVEFGIDIQKRSPFEKTIVVELANGCLPGYVCTSEAIKEGGYEVGASMLSGGAGDVLVKNALELLKNSR
jgi:neutral ceramidase